MQPTGVRGALRVQTAGADGNADRRRSSGIVSVVRVLFGLYLIVVVLVLFLIDRLEFNGIGGDYLKVAATLRAGDNLAFIDLVFLNVQVGLAFRTQHHDASTIGIPLIYLVSSRAKGQGARQG